MAEKMEKAMVKVKMNPSADNATAPPVDPPVFTEFLAVVLALPDLEPEYAARVEVTTGEVGETETVEVPS
jgi:hypothetical protein